MILGLEQPYKTDKIRPVYCYRMNMDHIMKSINQSINWYFTLKLKRHLIYVPYECGLNGVSSLVRN